VTSSPLLCSTHLTLSTNQRVFHRLLRCLYVIQNGLLQAAAFSASNSAYVRLSGLSNKNRTPMNTLMLYSFDPFFCVPDTYISDSYRICVPMNSALKPQKNVIQKFRTYCNPNAGSSSKCKLISAKCSAAFAAETARESPLYSIRNEEKSYPSVLMADFSSNIILWRSRYVYFTNLSTFLDSFFPRGR
jgi:hypothetical protein